MANLKKNHPKTFSKVLQYIKKYWALIICSVFFAAATVAMTLYVPVVTGQAIDLVVGQGQVDFAGLSGLLVRLAVVIAATAVMQWIMNTCNNKIVYHVVQDIRTEAFRKLEKLPFR